ncbi:neutral zinc metallopeptidase [Paenibacillus albidus]|nr:neutral zinc metallopeptidase [Paenibacillus albidus]
MKWKGRRSSTNVEDRRGRGGKTIVGGGIGGILILLIVTLLGGNPGDLLNSVTGTEPSTNTSYTETAEEKELAEFVSVVLADTEEVWSELFARQNKTYENPTLVLYTDSVQSACGVAGSAVGPFY